MLKYLYRAGMMIVALVVCAGCQKSDDSESLQEVTVQLVWAHQAQFAGFYAADQLGYYADEGMQVDFLSRGNPSDDVFATVLEGRADFGVGYGVGLLTARAKGLPVKAISVLHRRYALVFMTLQKSNIRTPHDFPGHTIRSLTPGGADIAFRALMTKLNIDPTSVRQLQTGFDLDMFLNGPLDIWPGYITNEVLVARKRGYAVNRILPSDYGVHLYGDTLYTTERLIAENPDLVLRFLRATLRGWRYAIENPEKAGPMALEYDPDLDPEHQIQLLQASVPLIHTGEDHIGWMRHSIWSGMGKMLTELQIIGQAIDVDQLYSMKFLNQIYSRRSR